MIYQELNDGNKIPALGYGVFQMTSQQVADHLPEAIAAGFRHIDTANAYYNEVAVGQVIRESSLPREDFFVTSKLFPQSYPADQCGPDIDATLERLGLDYLDLLLLHQPYGAYTEAWPVMEEYVLAGKIRSIGLSNFSPAKIRQVLEVATIKPAVLQVEMNPRNNQHALKAEFADQGFVYESWYPLGHGDRALLAEPVIAELAAKYGKSASQIILRWHLQEGNVVFPKTMNPAHMAENMDIFDFELESDEVAAIDAMPQRPYYHAPEKAPAWVWGPNDYSKQA